MSQLDDAIARAKASAPSRASSGQLEILVGDQFVTIEFSRLEPTVWIDLKATNPPRSNAPHDALFGCNPTSLAKAAAPLCSSTGIGDEREPITADQWSDIFTLLDAPAIEVIATFLWGLNEFEPLQRIVAAKKALRGGRKKQRS